MRTFARAKRCRRPLKTVAESRPSNSHHMPLDRPSTQPGTRPEPSIIERPPKGRRAPPFAKAIRADAALPPVALHVFWTRAR